jgi:hypothetical protein
MSVSLGCIIIRVPFYFSVFAATLREYVRLQYSSSSQQKPSFSPPIFTFVVDRPFPKSPQRAKHSVGVAF